ncbi:hypothetical protein [Flavobacterium sp.]|uniref:hypothetical protein n=1 Tax=Flavobacterium sp. TaxID=239 RepID=UPI0026394ED9|nr:hypothetical protein [Flavobacterium sp.]MDD2986112.1 hypothetical protein [Flavobacterium sp.]
MENKNTMVDDAILQSHPLDFGLVIEKSFENFKKIALLGGITILLLFLILFGVVMVFVAAFVGAASNLTETLTDFNPLDLTAVGIFIYVAVVVVITGLFAPIGAGFLKMAHLAKQDKPFSIGTVFEYYKTHHFKELFIAASLLTIVNLTLTTGLEYFGITIIGTVISYIIGFFTVLTVPLIVFGNQTALNAITKSAQLVVKQPFIIFGLLIVGFIGILIGLFGLCIGIIFTMPFWYSLTYTIYTHLIPMKESSEIEEIGTTFE